MHIRIYVYAYICNNNNNKRKRGTFVSRRTKSWKRKGTWAKLEGEMGKGGSDVPYCN